MTKENNNTLPISDENIDNEIYSPEFQEYIKKYNDSIKNAIGEISTDKHNIILEYIMSSPIISKKELSIVAKLTKTEVDRIINELKKGGTGENFSLIKPKSLEGPDGELIKFYYNIDSINTVESLEKFFMQSNEIYRKYFLYKLQEYTQGPNETLEDMESLIKHISGIIEFPYDFTKKMIDYLVKYNFFEINDKYQLSMTQYGEDIMPLLEHSHFEDGKLSIDHNKYLTNFVLDTIQKNPSFTPKKIDNYIESKLGFRIKFEDIKYFQKESLNKIAKGDIGSLYNTNFANIKLQKKYKIENGSYIFEFKKKDFKGDNLPEKISVRVVEIDEMFFLYSSRGANMTQKQVIESLKIPEDVWGIIKSRLSLTKNSDIASPYTIEQFGSNEEKRNEYISHAWSSYQKQKLRAGELDQKRKQVESMKKKLEKIYATQEGFVNRISDLIGKRKPRKIDKLYEQNITPITGSELTISFSDIHFGKKSHDKILNRLKKIINNVANSEQESINILCLGDLAEALVEGGMHTGQKEKMDWSSKDTFEMIMEITDILENFLVSIYKTGKKVNFYGIGGNHDRLGKNHDQDMSRTGALIIYELVKKGLLKYSEAEDIIVNYGTKKWNTVERDDFNYILHHGDDGATTKGISNPEKILWELGIKNKHNIILMGDKHHAIMKNPVQGGTFMQVPALAGAGEYDERLLLSSYPGYAEIKKGEDNLPEIGLKFLP